MVIDFHTHIFPDAIAEKTIRFLGEKASIGAKTDGTAAGLLHSMEEGGTDLSVILPVLTKPSQFRSILSFAERLNKTYPQRLFSFGGIHPDSEQYKQELRQIRDAGLLGVKLHPDYQGVMIDDPRYLRIMDYASELGLVIVTHAGVDIGYPDLVHCPPDRMRKVLDQIKPPKLVVAHYGGWRQWEMVYEYLAGEKVYLDTAFTLQEIPQELFLKIFQKHGAKHILYATDSPWGSQKEDLENLKKLPLTKEEQELVLWRNAAKLLHIQKKLW